MGLQTWPKTANTQTSCPCWCKCSKNQKYSKFCTIFVYQFQNPNTCPVTNAEHAILPLSDGAVITAGSNMRIRYWDIPQPECSYIISDPSYKACNFCFVKPKSSGKSSGANLAAKLPMHIDVQGGHQMASPAAATQLARYTVSEEASDQSLTIEEIECRNAFSQYQSTHYCTVDQQFVSTAHHDTITDLLQVNQYLVSAGRNGTVKVWR